MLEFFNSELFSAILFVLLGILGVLFSLRLGKLEKRIGELENERK